MKHQILLKYFPREIANMVLEYNIVSTHTVMENHKKMIFEFKTFDWLIYNFIDKEFVSMSVRYDILYSMNCILNGVYVDNTNVIYDIACDVLNYKHEKKLL